MHLFMRKKATGLMMILSAGGWLAAQTTSSALVGRVLDAKGHPLAKAVIRVESPALFQPKTLVADGRGEWRVGLLPPGTYKVTVSMADHLPKSHELRLGVGLTESVNTVLKHLEVQGAVVEVVGTSSQMAAAKAETKVSANFSGEQLQSLPVGSYTNIATYAPGVNSNFVVRGAAGATQMRFVVDGVDTRDERSGYSMVSPIQDAIEDVQMVLSAVNARNGRSLGSQLVMVTKQGGNTFSGSLRANYSRQWLWMSNRPHMMPTMEGAMGDAITTRDYNWTVSGPLVKDRLWFFVNGNKMAPTITARTKRYWNALSYGSADLLGPMMTRLPRTDAVLKAGPGDGFGLDIPTVGTNFAQSNYQDQVDYRFSGLINADHTLDLKVGTLETGNDPMLPLSAGSNNTLQPELLTKQYRRTVTGALSYKGNLSPNLLLEATYSRAIKEYRNAIGSVNGAEVPVLSNLQTYNPAITRFMVGTTGTSAPNATINAGNNLQMMRNAASPVPERHATRNFEVNLKAFASFLGQHEMDLGFEHYQAVLNPGTQFGVNNRIVYAGGWTQKGSDYRFPTVVFEGLNVNGQNYGALGPAPVLLEAWAPSADQFNTSRAYWVNDTWTVNDHVTVTLGARLNRFRMENPDGSVIQNDTALEPRFQAKYDPRGDGRDVFSLAFTRNNLSFSSDLSSRLVANPANYYTLRGWQGRNQPRLSTLGTGTDGGQYGVRWVDYATLTDTSNYATVPYGFVNGWVQNRMDNLRAPFSDQVELGYIHRYSDGGSVRASYVDKRFKNETVSYRDYTWDYLALSEDPSGRGGGMPQWLWQTRWTSKPDPRIYRSVELGVMDQLAPRLHLNLSWTYTHEATTDFTGRVNWAAIKSHPNNPLPPSTYLADGVSRRDHRVAGFLTYTEPLGKGQVAFTLATAYESAPTGSLSATHYFTLPTGLLDVADPVRNPKGYTVQSPGTLNTLNAYYNGGLGGFRTGRDSWNLDLMVNFSVPLGIKATTLVGSFGVMDLLHRVEWVGPYGANAPLQNNAVGQPTGRALGRFDSGGWGRDLAGTSEEYSQYSESKRQASFVVTLGLKF